MGENELARSFKKFSCPQNKSVENFLKQSSIEFTKRKQSITYIVNKGFDKTILGYFSLTLKPVTIRDDIISRTVARKISRISALDEETNSYNVAAYLIAQLGKNYAIPRSKQISGTELLGKAHQIIVNSQYRIGGIIEFLECENNEHLTQFYEKNGFRFFDTRKVLDASDGEPSELNQMFRII